MALVVKNLPGNAGDIRDTGSILGSGRSPGEGNSNLMQYSCLGNSIQTGAWQTYTHTHYTHYITHYTLIHTHTHMLFSRK